MKTKSDFISTVFLICLLLLVATLPANAQNTPDNNVASINAQSGIEHSNTKHIVIVNNKNNKPIKELYVGSKVRLKLTKASKVRGVIMSIDSASFIVNNRQVRFDEIIKISTRKDWVQVLGGALVVTGLAIWIDGAGEAYADAYSNQFFPLANEDISGGEHAFLGMALTGAGVALMLPAYHDLGKFSLMVISNKSNYFAQNSMKN